MNTMNNSDDTRPLRYWLKAVDRLIANESALAFANEGSSRRDWRLLNIVNGTMPARRPLNAFKLRDLVARGLVVAVGDEWSLTDEGRATRDRLGDIVESVRAKAIDAVSPEDLATTLASLKQIAEAFDWDADKPLRGGRRHRGFRHGRGHGPMHRFGPMHGRGFGFGHDVDRELREGHGHGRDHDREHGCGRSEHARGEHGHGHKRGHRGIHREHPHHGHAAPRHEHPRHDDSHAAQRAYERGFGAGFATGQHS